MDLKPHLIRYWLTPPVDEYREETVKAICTSYQQALELVKQGEQTVSTDELTGVQALERKHPGLPLAPGKVERWEFEYVRHGTRSFILSRDVVTGKIVAHACRPTRTETDFLAHLQAVVATKPEASRWHIVCDQLNTHQSASLVLLSSHRSLASKQIWGSKERAAAWPRWPAGLPCLRDPSHTGVFHYTPKHSSWMNQIEIWLSILVRKLLKRGSFASVEDLQTKVLADHSIITIGLWPSLSSGRTRARR